MDFSFSHDDEQFRLAVRAFFADRYPKDLLEKSASGAALSKDDYQRAERALAEQGWLCVSWPAEHGGCGWTTNQKYIFNEELEMAGAISPVPMGVIYVGPVICAFGTPEQQARWLPGIQQSTTFWAQGYSEPEAGSDLASLQCAARLENDEYVVNGSKIWTSQAQHADWIFLLVRTSTEARKQQGITFLCTPMSTPGIEVHPIITIDGQHTLNRVTLDDVRVPVSNRVGDEGEGWRYANFLLGNERTSYAHVAAKRLQLASLQELAAAHETLGGDPAFKAALAKLEIRVEALDTGVQRVLASLADGDAPGNEASTLKIQATELAQDITELHMQARAYGAVPKFDNGAPECDAAATMRYLGTRAQSIYGGANEIQKNIIAKRVLAL